MVALKVSVKLSLALDDDCVIVAESVAEAEVAEGVSDSVLVQL
jgi:hypothetical protein